MTAPPRNGNADTPGEKLRIAVVSHIFYPDELGGAALMTDLALFLQESGAQVKVTSTFPYYPRWQLADGDVGVWRRTDVFAGMPIRRVRMFIPRTPSTLTRLLSDFSFMFFVTFLGRKSWADADLIVTTCPMFGQTLAMRFATPFRRVPKLIIVQDFVVDAAVELGMIKYAWLGKLLKGAERWAFRSGNTLTTISEEMLSKLRTIAGDDRRTLLIPNWIHGSLARSIEARRALAPERRRNFLFYSGNVGRKQGLPDFLGSFDGTGSGWTIRINGSGAEFEQLAQACTGRIDVALHGLEDEGAYIDSLLSCSACLVTQKPGVSANFLPSKILPALASGTPILAVCERGSPLGREVLEADCGAVVEPGNPGALSAILKAWAESPELLARCSANALLRAKRYGRTQVLGQYWDEISRLVAPKCKNIGQPEAAKDRKNGEQPITPPAFSPVPGLSLPNPQPDATVSVLIVVEPGEGGVLRHVEGLTGFLLSRDVRVHLAYSDRRGSRRLAALVDKVRRAGGRVFNLQVINFPEFRDARAIWQLRGIIRQLNPDIVHAHSSKAGVLARIAGLSFPRSAVIYTPHAYYGMSRVSLLKRAVYNTVETVLARVGTTINISADEAAFGRRKHRVPLDQRQIIPNPVDTTCFQAASPAQREAARARFGLAENDKTVGLVARMCWQKDPETAYYGVAEAARRHPNLRFLHIGWGKWTKYLLGLARKQGFAKRLQILDYAEDTTPFFHAIDALLISSRYEAGWPFVALEALACNLPVICATCPGMSDIGRAGLSHVYPFAPEDPAACARAIEAWLSQQESSLESCNHRAHAIRNFSIEACFGDVLKLYRARAAVTAPARVGVFAQAGRAEQTI